jgi:large subunit ribosomal protein L24
MNKHSKKSHIKIGDTIQIIAGNQKGFIGTINAIMRKKSLVFVEGVLPRIKYAKNPQGGEQQKMELQIPIHISNVMLWDKETNKASRVGYKADGTTKTRYFKKSGNVVS